MSAEIAPYLGAVAVLGAAAVTWMVRLAPARPVPASAAPAFTVPEPGVRWLRCDELVCAHMTHRHLPVSDGGWQCSNCRSVKGGVES